MTTERTVFAQTAIDNYLAQPVNAEYVDVDPAVLNEITETDAFVAGWEASVDHLVTVAENLDVPGPLKAIIVSLLESNRAERETNS